MGGELPDLLRELLGVGKPAAGHGLGGPGVATRGAPDTQVDAARIERLEHGDVGKLAAEVLVVDLGDVRIVDRREHPVFALQPLEIDAVLARAAVEDLERDGDAVGGALGEIDHRLAALPDGMQHPVARDARLRHGVIVPLYKIPRRKAEMSAISSGQTECGIGYARHCTL